MDHLGELPHNNTTHTIPHPCPWFTPLMLNEYCAEKYTSTKDGFQG